jgi:hypothetical protein
VAYSWRMKFERAEHHLRDFCDRIAPLKERRCYPAPKQIDPTRRGVLYAYRLQIPGSHDPLGRRLAMA